MRRIDEQIRRFTSGERGNLCLKHRVANRNADSSIIQRFRALIIAFQAQNCAIGVRHPTCRRAKFLDGVLKGFIRCVEITAKSGDQALVIPAKNLKDCPLIQRIEFGRNLSKSR